RVVQVTLPYGPAKGEKWPANNFIDEKLAGKWRDLGLAPSGPVSDETFLRRLYLDAIGTLPTPAEARAFLADTRADRRAQRDRPRAGAAGVGRFLGPEVGRPPAHQPRPAAGEGDVELPQLGARQPARRQVGRSHGA